MKTFCEFFLTVIAFYILQLLTNNVYKVFNDSFPTASVQLTLKPSSTVS